MTSSLPALPDTVPSRLITSGTKSSPFYYNKRELFPDLQLSDGYNRIGILLSSDRRIHIYLDGIHHKSSRPLDPVLWGAVDVSGTCTKIKSELLSGKCLKLGY